MDRERDRHSEHPDARADHLTAALNEPETPGRRAGDRATTDKQHSSIRASKTDGHR
jgi:hypothetical protein